MGDTVDYDEVKRYCSQEAVITTSNIRIIENSKIELIGLFEICINFLSEC